MRRYSRFIKLPHYPHTPRLPVMRLPKNRTKRQRQQCLLKGGSFKTSLHKGYFIGPLSVNATNEDIGLLQSNSGYKQKNNPTSRFLRRPSPPPENLFNPNNISINTVCISSLGLCPSFCYTSHRDEIDWERRCDDCGNASTRGLKVGLFLLRTS